MKFYKKKKTKGIKVLKKKKTKKLKDIYLMTDDIFTEFLIVLIWNYSRLK